jgi:hypothetical protein
MIRLPVSFLVSVGAVVASLAACGTTSSNQAGTTGWHRGLVVKAGDAASLDAIDGGDCRRRAEVGASPEGRYVEIQFFVGRHAHLRIVPLAEGAHVVPGDAVYFKPGSCSEAVIHLER